MIEHVYWIPLIPFFASLIILFVGKESDHSPMPYVGIAAMAACFLHSCGLVIRMIGHHLSLPYYHAIPWFSFGDYEMSLGVFIDGSAIAMLFVVTLVSLLVQIYSLGYMHGDARFKRYYAYLSFFTASMLGLVVASNLFLLFACWELVGVSSYLLIGFWFEKPGPAYASKKAFITTKLGDLGLYAGLLLLFAYTGTFDLPMLASRVQMGTQYVPTWVATTVGLLFLFGAAGKSAQVPLFVWLPDAMEGPTPVSALIHAATMVAAGVYLVARTYFLYAVAPVAMETVAWVGLITAFLAATMALTAFDIKRVLAFSTISQLGYMMLGLGVGGYTAGLFHLTTHAFFKALLFLGAGSVIHAVHTNDMREMGGLSKKMPVTFLTMGIATLAISGFPGLSGWFSKEEILHHVYLHNPRMWLVALATAGLTTFYMFRLIFLTFLGNSRDHHKWDHAHESPGVMTGPLCLLAALSISAGWIKNLFASFVSFGTQATETMAVKVEMMHAPGWLGPAAIGIFLIGFSAAYYFYGSGDLSLAEHMRERLAPVALILEERYGFDRFYLICVDLSDMLARTLFWIDANIIDAIFVDGWGLLTYAFAELNNFLDTFFVDGLVDGVGSLTQDVGWGLHSLIDGQVQEYLLYIALSFGAFALIGGHITISLLYGAMLVLATALVARFFIAR